MKDLFIDIETYSGTSIDNGVYEYAADENFQVLLFGYSIDNEMVQVVDVARGEELPGEIRAALTDPAVLKHAHNAAFERVCLSRFLGMPVGTYLDPAQWRCTMVKCAYYGMPLKLENAGIALKIDRKKFADTGKKLIKKFCVPSEGGRPECYPEENPIEWETFKEYNIRDVEAEMDIDGALPGIKYEKLWDEYAADQRINDNGALIDRVLVDNIVHINEEIDAEHLRRFKELTYIDNPKSVTQLKAWFAAKGYSLPSLDKKAIANLTKTCKDPEILEVLKLRQLTAKSSITKYTTMQELTTNAPDHRARGCFQFYGSHTGRWCLTGDHEVLTLKGWVRLDEWQGGEIAVYNPSLETVSFQKSKALVFDYEGIMYEYDDKRCAQKSTPDHKMLYKPRYDKPWITGTVEEMAKSRPIIPFTGNRIVSSNLDHSMLRVLIMTQADGSFAADGTVKYGFTKLRKVERCKKLLREAGLLFNYTVYENNPKTRHQIDIAARNVPLWLRLFQNKTFDTWLFNESPDVFFEELQYWDGSRSAANSIQYVTCNKQNADIVQAFAHITGRACSVRVKDRRAEHPNWSVAYVVDIWLTPKNAHEIKAKPTQEYYSGKVYCAETTTGFFLVRRKGRVWVTGNSGRHVQLQNLPQNHLPELDSARQLVREGDRETLELLYDNLPQVLSELIRTAIVAPEGKTLIVADFSAIEARVIAWMAGEKWRTEVFKNGGDIYCASASAMFKVPVEKNGINGHLRQKGKIAELALGYGGSVGALKAFGALELGLAESELEGIVSSWRSANPNIVKLWWAVGNAAIDLIEGNARMKIINGKLKIAYQRGRLLIHLPSGRLLVYPDAAIGENQFGGKCMTYSGVNSTTHQWDTIDTYGPRLVENIIQAIARDLLAEALLRISKNPDCKIIAHVHDEIIIEADPAKVTLDDMIKAMCVLPEWGEGLILNAAGFTNDYYMKD